MASGETYEEFVRKFERPKTTDDCYTPPQIYDAVRDFVATRYGLPCHSFVRPFYPGGEYEAEDYSGKVVVDNPPFSQLARICSFYEERDIPFFMFAPGLTALSSVRRLPGVSIVYVGVSLTYENNAKVNTAFVTNLEPTPVLMSSAELRAALLKAQPNRSRGKVPREPDTYTSADLSNLAKRTDYSVARADTAPPDKKYYGGAITSKDLTRALAER